MIEAPAGPALLDAARKTLLDELLPTLADDKRYAALMIANAMAIAARVARSGETVGEALDVRVGALVGTSQADPWRAFSAAIRGGRFDSGTPDHDAALALLRDYANARCAVSSPKALRQ